MDVWALFALNHLGLPLQTDSEVWFHDNEDLNSLRALSRPVRQHSLVQKCCIPLTKSSLSAAAGIQYVLSVADGSSIPGFLCLR